MANAENAFQAKKEPCENAEVAADKQKCSHYHEKAVSYAIPLRVVNSRDENYN